MRGHETPVFFLSEEFLAEPNLDFVVQKLQVFANSLNAFLKGGMEKMNLGQLIPGRWLMIY